MEAIGDRYRGDKTLMKDKQVYRNMVGSLTEEGKQKLIENYDWAAQRSTYLLDLLVKEELVIH